MINSDCFHAALRSMHDADVTRAPALWRSPVDPSAGWPRDMLGQTPACVRDRTTPAGSLSLGIGRKESRHLLGSREE